MDLFQPNSPYSPAFIVADNLVFSKEGGYHCNPNDLGGETHFGISAMACPKEDIANLTQTRAQFLYHRDYWRAACNFFFLQNITPLNRR